jgi:N-acyl-D-aspartate/D-glutamate deacylase
MAKVKVIAKYLRVLTQFRFLRNVSRHGRVLVGLIGAFVLTIAIAAAQTKKSGAEVYDIVVVHGRLMDPESGLDTIRNIGISGATIKIITTEEIAGLTTVDAKDLVVAPGFIDLHQHDHESSDYALKVMDGVTSTLELETGTADVEGWYARRSGKSLINFGVSAGHLPARVAVMGDPGGDYPSGDAAHRVATEAEIAKITALVRKGLQQGAVAVGTKPGLTPGASNWEMLEVFRVAAEFRAPVVDHQRDTRTDQATLETRGLLGIDEAFAAAAITGAPLHIAHVFSPRVFQMVAEAQARGMDVTTECYPYTSGAIPLQTTIFDPGWQERLGIGYKDLIWAETGERLTEESFARYRQSPTTKRVIFVALTENMVKAAISNPLTMIISDGNRYHPREAGTYSRVLGKYVREEQTLTLMEALRKMTIMPARRLEQRAPMMKKKGRINVGADADITIFDAGRIIDHATIEAPARPSEGVHFVLVNGVLVVKDGEPQGTVAPGRAIRAEVR